MKYTREYLWKVFQEINRDKRKLTTDEILDLLKIVKEDYVEDFTNPIFSALDCLCYGSDYIETNEPLLFKSYFTQKLDSYHLGEVFRYVGILGLSHLYLDELKCYATFKNIDFDNFESYSSAIFVFGHHIYKTLDEQLYNFLLDQLNQLLIEFKKDSFDVELKKDFIFFLKSYLSALYCSVDGKVDYKKYPKEDDIEFIKLEDVPKLKS